MVPPEPVSPVARRLTAAVLGLVTLGIYIRTVAPTVAGGDSGELITAGYTLGVVHPPGYPLYTLLAKIFTFIPIGTIAWRVNLLSAVCGAVAATLLFLAVARWSRSVWAGLVSASLFAFSRRVWPHAVTAEVFALNNLFIAGIVYLTVRFSGERPAEASAVRRRHMVACVLFFWIGLGLTNHHTLIFYALPAAIFVLLDPTLREPRRIGTYLLCGVMGLLPYLYLPFASARHTCRSRCRHRETSDRSRLSRFRSDRISPADWLPTSLGHLQIYCGSARSWRLWGWRCGYGGRRDLSHGAGPARFFSFSSGSTASPMDRSNPASRALSKDVSGSSRTC